MKTEQGYPAQYSHADDHLAVRLFEAAARGEALPIHDINRAVASGSIDRRNALAYFGAQRWPEVSDEEALPPAGSREVSPVIARYADGRTFLTEALEEIMMLADSGLLGTGRHRREALALALDQLRTIRDSMVSALLTERAKRGRAIIRSRAHYRAEKALLPPLEMRRLAAAIVVEWALAVVAAPDDDPAEIAEIVLQSHSL